MRDEGYIKFDCQWSNLPADIPKSIFLKLNYWRDRLYQSGLIGAYSDGIGFGNISMRVGFSREFWITGSATGQFETLTKEHYAHVTDFDVFQNRVWCWGRNRASSESMSHAMLYYCDPKIKAVVHVHHKVLWQQLMHRVPTTSIDINYGTTEMALALKNLYNTTDLSQKKILVMAGHEEGIVTFGQTVSKAVELIIHQLEQLK